MRGVRTVPLLVLFCLAATAVVPLAASPAGAQTGDLTAFCAVRLEANSAETKAENLAVIQKILTVAPAEITPALEDLLAGVKKKGNKFFETEDGFQVITQVDTFVFENCPGTQVPVTAIDYEFEDVPATLPAGVAKLALTNEAPKEVHEMIVFGLTDEGAAMSPEELLALPQGKAQKLATPQAFLFAPPGATFYAITELAPGEYLYACFLPIGGKNTKKAKPHWTQGMYGTFTVS